MTSSIPTTSKVKLATRPKFALVKWLTGVDSGKFTVLDSSWLLNFDFSSFQLHREESYVVEWKEQKKVPPGGWPCFDAVVLNLGEIPAILGRMKEATKVLEANGAKKVVPQHPHVEESAAPTNRIEILQGSEVFVDPAAWLSAKACSTPGSFVGRLLMSLFDTKTLLSSNLKGGASKFVDKGHERKEQLDPKKILALKGATKVAFPDLKDAQFGTYVNQKIANLRSKLKKDSSQE